MPSLEKYNFQNHLQPKHDCGAAPELFFLRIGYKQAITTNTHVNIHLYVDACARVPIHTDGE